MQPVKLAVYRTKFSCSALLQVKIKGNIFCDYLKKQTKKNFYHTWAHLKQCLVCYMAWYAIMYGLMTENVWNSIFNTKIVSVF